MVSAFYTKRSFGVNMFASKNKVLQESVKKGIGLPLPRGSPVWRPTVS